ncbi:uncharacterized protein EI97DRAFT_471682, partial [Westerdykella ornata]
TSHLHNPKFLSHSNLYASLPPLHYFLSDKYIQFFCSLLPITMTEKKPFWKGLTVSLFGGKKLKKPKPPTMEQPAPEPRAPETNQGQQTALVPSMADLFGGSPSAYPPVPQGLFQQQQEAAVGRRTLPVNTPIPGHGPSRQFPVQGLPAPHQREGRRRPRAPVLPPRRSPPSWKKRPVGPFRNPIPLFFPGMPSSLRPEDPEFDDWLAENSWLDDEGRLLSQLEREKLLERKRKEEAGEEIEEEGKKEEMEAGKEEGEEKEAEEKEHGGEEQEGDWEDVEDEE